jgi:pimeloyl-ACP methyl ester carboxylesterase
VAEITVPTLVICGDEDQPTPPELSRELHKAIAGSRLEMIPNAGHLTNLEQPDAFNSAVERFLAQVEQP